MKKELAALDYYSESLKKVHILTREEERLIGERIKELGKKRRSRKAETELNELRCKLIESCLKLAYRQAIKYLKSGLDLEDLVEAANEGLIKASKKYNPDIGVRFSAYAIWWINQSITMEMRANGRTIRLPLNVIRFLGKIEKLLNSRQILSDREIAGNIGVGIKRLKQIKDAPTCSVSLNKTVDSENGSTLIDLISDDSPADPLTVYTDKEYCESVRKAVSEKLTGRDLRIINMRYGLNKTKVKSLKEAGKILGISGERVRQRQEEILKKLYRSPEIRKLELGY